MLRDARARGDNTRESPRAFLTTYPRAGRSQLTVTRGLVRHLSAVVQVDNVGGGRRVERDNARLIAGRTLLAGARLEY